MLAASQGNSSLGVTGRAFQVGLASKTFLYRARNISAPIASATTRPTSSRDGHKSFK